MANLLLRIVLISNIVSPTEKHGGDTQTDSLGSNPVSEHLSRHGLFLLQNVAAASSVFSSRRRTFQAVRRRFFSALTFEGRLSETFLLRMILIYCIVTATGKRSAESNANGIFGVDSGFWLWSVLFLLRHTTFQFLGVLLAPPNFSGCSAAFFHFSSQDM